MNVLLLCCKFKKDKSMKKGRFSLLGIVALFLGLILVSCSDDDDQGGVIDTGIHKIAKQKKAILTDSQSSLLTLNLIP
jgi:hypothetical protein